MDYLNECSSYDEELKVLYTESSKVDTGARSGEDEATEVEQATPNNLCSEQLKASCEMVSQVIVNI